MDYQLLRTTLVVIRLSFSSLGNNHVDESEELPWGWVKRYHTTRADNHQFLVPAEPEGDANVAAEKVEEEEEDYDSFNTDFASFTYNRHKDPNVDVWYEQVDDKGEYDAA